MDLTDSQKLVIKTKDKSILVSASAGSGKTFVVVERIIESIKSGKDISNLLVLTFTNAAASELKERIVKKLHEVKNEYIKNDNIEEAKRISKQISKVAISDISTIHSFCLNIIRNNFYILGIDPMVNTIDQTKSSIILGGIISDIMDEEFEKKDPIFLDILDIEKTEDSVITTITMLYNEYKKILYNEKWLDMVKNSYNESVNDDLSITNFGKIIINSIKDKLNLLKYELEQLIDKCDEVEGFEQRKEVLQIINKKITNTINIETYNGLYEYMDELLSIPRLPQNTVSAPQSCQGTGQAGIRAARAVRLPSDWTCSRIRPARRGQPTS